MDDYYTIKDWDSVFETKASRRCTQERRFVLVPTKRQSDSYHALMATREGREAYCVFIGLCRIAATCPRRGYLIDDKGPWDVARAAPVLGIESRVVERAVEMLASRRIGWLVPSNAPPNAPNAHPKRTANDPESAPEAHHESTENDPPKAPSTSRNWIGMGIGIEKPTLTLPQSGREPAEFSAGEWAACQAAMRALSRVRAAADAGETHKRCADALCVDGFSVLTEYAVPDRGDGTAGRIDILAIGHGGRVAIEIDRRTAREKSVEKLRSVNAWRVIVLRDAADRFDKPEGIAGIVTLKRAESHGASRTTRADRAAAKREAAQRAFDAAQAAEAQKRAQRAGVTHG